MDDYEKKNKFDYLKEIFLIGYNELYFIKTIVSLIYHVVIYWEKKIKKTFLLFIFSRKSRVNIFLSLQVPTVYLRYIPSNAETLDS